MNMFDAPLDFNESVGYAFLDHISKLQPSDWCSPIPNGRRAGDALTHDLRHAHSQSVILYASTPMYVLHVTHYV